MRHARVLGALLVASAVLVVPTYARSASAAPRTTFYDAFSGKAGADVSSSRWLHNTGNSTNGWGNHELEYYTPGAQNSATDGQGHLVITARKQAAGTCWNGEPCPYTSARIMTKTKFSQAYGQISARIRLDASPDSSVGYWPAFWALGDDIDTAGYPVCGEMDFMENVGGDGLVYSSLHAAATNADPMVDYVTKYDLRGHDPTGWHTYTADWTPAQVTFSVDGHVYGAATKAAWGKAWKFDHPFFLVLNVAVGGDWPGTPNSKSTFPMTMEVDYVKVTN